MHVLIGDRFYDSSQVPIMILFDAGEAPQFKSTPSNVDIFCSWPSKWSKEEAETWVKDNQPRLVASTKMIIVQSEADLKLEEILTMGKGRGLEDILVMDKKDLK